MKKKGNYFVKSGYHAEIENQENETNVDEKRNLEVRSYENNNINTDRNNNHNLGSQTNNNSQTTTMISEANNNINGNIGQNIDFNTNLRSGASTQSNFPWNKLQNLKVPQKIKHFMWKACNEALLMKMNLIKRNMNIDPNCLICKEHNKTTFHGFVNCPLIMQL